jgi:hypothetical protein
MKLDNLTLGLALADHAVNHPQQSELMQLADYLLTHPSSRVYYERVLVALGIDPDTVPSELWGETVPDEAHGAAKLKTAITQLNEQWGKGKLQRMIVVRNLAWQATLLARRLEKDLDEDAKRVVGRNGGSTAGLLNAFIAAPATRVALDAIALQPSE